MLERCCPSPKPSLFCHQRASWPWTGQRDSGRWTRKKTSELPLSNHMWHSVVIALECNIITARIVRPLSLLYTMTWQNVWCWAPSCVLYVLYMRGYSIKSVWDGDVLSALILSDTSQVLGTQHCLMLNVAAVWFPCMWTCSSHQVLGVGPACNEVGGAHGRHACDVCKRSLYIVILDTRPRQ